MKNYLKLLGLLNPFFLLLGLSTSCEKAILDEEEESKEVSSTSKNSSGSVNQKEGNVTLSVSEFIIGPFDDNATRATTDLTDYCTRLVFAVYQNGKKVEGCSQKKENDNFGEVTMSLMPGTYQLLALAHSSVGGNPTVTDPENIKFTNALCYSDTFSFYGDLEVTSKPKTYNLSLTRNVSCLNFTIQDKFPDEVKYVHFYYTGGSGVLNAVTGYGANVNSQQEKTVDISSYTPPLTFHLYTFLQKDTCSLQLKVTAFMEDMKTVVLERTFEDVKMKHRNVTSYTGYFFKSDSQFSLTAETDWGNPYYEYTY